MLRGHIDRATRERVEGWLSLEGRSLREDVVLAFIGSTCVGQGTVNVFRQDLADARMGDGWAGFSFAIQPEMFQNPAAVAIRLADSDAYILPAHVLEERTDATSAPPRPYPAPVDLNWMRGKGWLTAELHQRLRILSAFGALEVPVYETESFSADPLAHPPLQQVLAEMFDVLVRKPHVLSAVRARDAREMDDLLARHRHESAGTPCFGVICSSGRLPLSIVEGSYLLSTQRVTSQAADIRSRGVEYSADAHCLLVVNLDSAYVTVASAPWPDVVTLIMPNH